MTKELEQANDLRSKVLEYKIELEEALKNRDVEIDGLRNNFNIKNAEFQLEFNLLKTELSAQKQENERLSKEHVYNLSFCNKSSDFKINEEIKQNNKSNLFASNDKKIFGSVY